MRPEIAVGLGISILILLLLIPEIFARVRDDATFGYEGERWGRYAYEIRRTGSYVYSGTSYRLAYTHKPSQTASQILQEWFTREGIPTRERKFYSCEIRLNEEKEWRARVSGV